MCLRTEVQRVTRDLMRGSGRTVVGVSDENGVSDLTTLTDIPPERFPLFTCLSEIMLLVDRTLPGGPFISASEGALGADTEAGALTAMDAYFADDFDDEVVRATGGQWGSGIGDDDDDEDEQLDVSGVQNQSAMTQEMTWILFMRSVWDKLPSKDKKGLDASLCGRRFCRTSKGASKA